MSTGTDKDCIAAPSRVIFNFVARCNMACTFCYVPFDAHRATYRSAAEVLERVLAWRVKSLVIGGGDPLIYDYTPRLLALARKRQPRLFVQLDTNALGPLRNRLLAIASEVNLIGLPVDGLTSDVSFSMRRHATHGLQMTRLARRLAQEGHAVKINTVVSRQNFAEIDDIGAAIESTGAKIWSLYQFWPIGPAAVASAKHHAIPSHQFDATVEAQRHRRRHIAVENSGSVSDRAGGYFFVAPTGRAFCTSPDGAHFIELGDILRDELHVLRAWGLHANHRRNEDRFEMRATLLRRERTPQ